MISSKELISTNKELIKLTNLRVNVHAVDVISPKIHIVENNRVEAKEKIAKTSVIYTGEAIVRYWRAPTGKFSTSFGLLASLCQWIESHEKDCLFKLLFDRLSQLYPHTKLDMQKELKKIYSSQLQSEKDLENIMKDPEHWIIVWLTRNSFQDVSNKTGCERSLFIGGSKFNHSCDPNCKWFVSDGKMKVSTVKDILPGEECTISYVNPSLLQGDLSTRRKVLLKKCTFVCMCLHCLSEGNKTKKVCNEEKEEKEEKEENSYTKLCYHCGKNDENLKLCGKCKSTKYCSKECQKQNWKTHKKNCT